MNNNDSNNTDKKKTLQDDDNEQLVWERLQNEAIAAQRWRLEQEMKLAGKPSGSASGFLSTTLLPWKNYSVIAAVISFIIVSLVFVFWLYQAM